MQELKGTFKRYSIANVVSLSCSGSAYTCSSFPVSCIESALHLICDLPVLLLTYLFMLRFVKLVSHYDKIASSDIKGTFSMKF